MRRLGSRDGGSHRGTGLGGESHERVELSLGGPRGGVWGRHARDLRVSEHGPRSRGNGGESRSDQ